MNVRSRTQMMNRATAFEIVLVSNDATVKILGYSERKTRGVLLDTARANGPEVAALMTEEELDMAWKYSAANGLAFGRGNVVVRFSGRTERDVANEQGKI